MMGIRNWHGCQYGGAWGHILPWLGSFAVALGVTLSHAGRCKGLAAEEVADAAVALYTEEKQWIQAQVAESGTVGVGIRVTLRLGTGSDQDQDQDQA